MKAKRFYIYVLIIQLISVVPSSPGAICYIYMNILLMQRILLSGMFNKRMQAASKRVKFCCCKIINILMKLDGRKRWSITEFLLKEHSIL